jgi:fumarylpyruvate hydrolase
MSTAVPVPAPVTVPIAGSSDRYPVHRIYCVGRNYAAHVQEMGGDPRRDAPVFFTKPADAILADGADFPYPPRSSDVHHEVELVVALARGGRNINADAALACVYGYAVGNDWTRRDLQAGAKRAGQPWDMAKGFDHSAALSPLYPVSTVGHIDRGPIALRVNGALRQSSDVSAMLWSVAEIIAELSTYVLLAPGDLIYTGTPDGVGPVQVGDWVEASIAGLGTLSNRVVETR